MVRRRRIGGRGWHGDKTPRISQETAWRNHLLGVNLDLVQNRRIGTNTGPLPHQAMSHNQNPRTNRGMVPYFQDTPVSVENGARPDGNPRRNPQLTIGISLEEDS